MSLLIDTNILLWLLLGISRLSKKHQKLLEDAEKLCVSVVSFWEIGIKLSGKGYDDLVLPADWHHEFKQATEQFGISIIDIGIDDCKQVQSLPFHHRDPFDRMLIAQAMGHNLAVMTSDKVMQEYDVEVINC